MFRISSILFSYLFRRIVFFWLKNQLKQTVIINEKTIKFVNYNVNVWKEIIDQSGFILAVAVDISLQKYQRGVSFFISNTFFRPLLECCLAKFTKIGLTLLYLGRVQSFGKSLKFIPQYFSRLLLLIKVLLTEKAWYTVGEIGRPSENFNLDFGPQNILD